ncbi:hypothetical protein ACFPH6_40095 [Streptomyces xiangluensis]|uniref:Uncharacterized protein n=1 Tax=Streptomyces xiangluensis TaxID=2665720 RepID=A0ABV8YZC9_9ACTN
MAAQHFRPCADLVGDALRQCLECGFDPGQVAVLMELRVVDEQATRAQELADGLGREVRIQPCQIMDVALVDGVLGTEPPVRPADGVRRRDTGWCWRPVGLSGPRSP